MSNEKKSEWKVALDTGDIFDVKCDRLDFLEDIVTAYVGEEIVFSAARFLYAIKC